MIALWVAAALAQDPPAPAGGAEPAAREVVVYGEILVQQARQEVVTALREAGYTEEIDRGDHTIYRAPEAWRGQVVIYDDGYMVTKRQPVHFKSPKMPWGEEGSVASGIGCVLYPWLCVRTSGQTVSHRKFMAQETRASQAAADEVHVWAERIADLHTTERVAALPDQLAALWERGAPIDGQGPTLQTMDERKQALLQFWETRTESPWGLEVRAAVEAFIRAVVQHSDTPITRAELAAFNARSQALRPIGVEGVDLPAASP